MEAVLTQEKSIDPEPFCTDPLSERFSHISTVTADVAEVEPIDPLNLSLLETSFPLNTTAVGLVALVIPPVGAVPVALSTRSVQVVLPAV